LTSAQLALGSVTTRTIRSSPGTVISADRTVGDQIPTGTAVNLVVASGSVTLVDVVGYGRGGSALTADDVKLTPRS
jgi:serine/threonine-protein kinase